MENIKEIVVEGFKQNSAEHIKMTECNQNEHHEIRESQLKALETKADKQIVDDLKALANQKADKEIVDQIRADIRRVVWLIVGGVISAVLAIVLKL